MTNQQNNQSINPELESHSAENQKELAKELAQKGKQLWKENRRGEAMSAYEQSAALDPEGPGALLLEHSRQIMAFFNPDQFNP